VSSVTEACAADEGRTVFMAAQHRGLSCQHMLLWLAAVYAANGATDEFTQGT
jgi:hypothetical protein